MTGRLPLGSELWLLCVDPKTQTYVPSCAGIVNAVSTRGYLVGKKWFALGTYPLFGSKREALDWIAEHPHTVPTITGR